MLYIVIGNAIVYLFTRMDRSYFLYEKLLFNPALILRGEVWRLISFIFLPVNNGLLWVVISLYFYYFIGSTLERYWGSGKFTVYYLSGVLFTMLYGLLAGLITGQEYMYIDASYINLSMFFAFAALFPETQVLLFFIIPVKIKWLAIVDAIFFAIGVITNPFPVNLLPIIAILNFFLFCGSSLIRLFRSFQPSAAKRRFTFRSDMRSAERRENSRPYRHKCAVCGKTDVDYPDLEFRYCSRCAGYHCFCQDHINNHVHFE